MGFAVAAFLSASFTYRSSIDTRINSAQTDRLVRHGSIDLTDARVRSATGEKVELRTGILVIDLPEGNYSIYGIGISLLGAPIYALLMPFDASDAVKEGAVAIIYSAIAITLFLALCMRLFPRRLAVAATLAFGFGTTLWPVASLAYWQQAPVCALVVGGLLALTSPTPRGARWAGAAFGTAVFVRPTLITLLVGAVVVVSIRSRNSAGWFAVSAAPFILGIVIQSKLVWGNWFRGGYPRAGVGFQTPLIEGLEGILFSWWRGVIVYSPFLVLSVIGLAYVIRRRSSDLGRILVCMGVASALTLLLYARWDTWWGGLAQFGYRYPLEVVPVLVVLAGYAVHRHPRLEPWAAGMVAIACINMANGAGRSRFGFDATPFPTRLADSPLGQAWIVAVDQPWPSVMRLLGLAALAGVMSLAAKRTPDPATSMTRFRTAG